jgi:stage IV sporulation protein FA
MKEIERDPEKLWKQDRNHWIEPGLEEHGRSEHEERRAYSFFQHIKFQTIVAIVVFLALLIASYIEHPTVEDTKKWMRNEISSSIDFVSIAIWYDELFEGSPAFIPRFGNKSQLALAKQSTSEAVAPIEQGILLRSFADLLNGVEIAGEKQAEVHAVEKGRVILVPQQQDSVIIQHANEKMSIYTRLNEVKVEVSEWVEAGTVIGRLAPIAGEDYSVLFLAMKQGDQYIDPLEVIAIE